GIREHWWLQGMLGGMKPHYDCIKAFSETDFTEDLRKFDVPTLVLHGDDDQIVPIGASALMSAKIVKNAKLKVYPGFPHGTPATHADQINADLLAFFKQSKEMAAYVLSGRHSRQGRPDLLTCPRHAHPLLIWILALALTLGVVHPVTAKLKSEFIPSNYQ